MIIKEGTKKRKHFAHKSNSNCSGENYIHKIWKRRIKKRFECQKDFIIKYVVVTPCEEIMSCPIRKHVNNPKCNMIFPQEIDLKKEYDTCNIEFYYGGFIGDLALTDSKHPEKEPLFIEIAYTHSCEPEKIDSGIKIIELKVSDDRDVDIPFYEVGKFSISTNSGNPYKGTKKLPPVRFYNFNRSPYHTIRTFSFSHDASGRCTLQKSSKFTCNTKERDIGNADLEIDIADCIINSRPGYYEEAILALAVKEELSIFDCRLCRHKMDYNDFHRGCKVQEFSTAQKCRNYRVLLRDIQSLSNRLSGIPHTIRKRE